MNTTHKIADVITPQIDDSPVDGYNWGVATAGGRQITGLMLEAQGQPVAFIHCARRGYEGRIILELVERTILHQRRSARETMKAMLAAEDWASDVYNHIYRVYYAGEFSL